MQARFDTAEVQGVGHLPYAGGGTAGDEVCEEELADRGIRIERDSRGLRHIRMTADPQILLKDGRPAEVECHLVHCRSTYTFTESGPTFGWIPPHGDLGWTCPECAASLINHVIKR